MRENKLILPISILLGCVILGGFYYASEANRQASIEKQQQIELQAKADADQVKIAQDQADKEAQRQVAEQAQRDKQVQQQAIASQKAACANDAQQSAVDMYKKSYFCTVQHSSDCNAVPAIYLKNDYENAYSACLDINGLK